jgi:sugar transferase (PEP-CTERM system associated)
MIRIFRLFIPVGSITVLLSEILIVPSAFLLAAYFFLPVDPANYLLYDGGLINIGIIMACVLGGMYFQDLYTEIYVKSRIVLVQQILFMMGAAFLSQSAFSYLTTLRMPLRMMIPGSLIAAAGIFGWRVFFTSFALQMVGRDHLLLVGGSPLLADIATHIDEHPEQGLQVIGYLSDPNDPGAAPPGRKYLGDIGDLRAVVAATQPSRIVLGMFERRGRVPVHELLDLRFSGHIIEEVASVYERVCGRVSLKELRPSQLIYSGELGPRAQTLRYQSLWNLAAAAAGLVIAAPLMILTALAVRLTSPGPVLYRQVRVGLGGAPFTLYKFRSMRVDAEAKTGAVWASKDDPRTTAVGKIIRKIRFDELPQLFNVLRGEMTIVGPRPERPEFVKTLSEQIPYYRQRHCVRPGITGWAQINYKYGDTVEDTITKLEYDLYYIKNTSFTMDMYIIFHTLKAMLLTRGAQ